MARSVLCAVLATAVALGVASSASADHTTSVDVQSVTLGADNSVVVTATVECTEGYDVFYSVYVEQHVGKAPYNWGSGVIGYTPCTTTGPQTVQAGPIYGYGPFRPGPATIQSFVNVCDAAYTDCASLYGVVDEVRITRS